MSASTQVEVGLNSIDSLEPVMTVANVKRRIDRESGRALEILGHAIEYLTDEYVHEFVTTDRLSVSGRDGRLQAVQLLMAANREIYYQCPVVEDLASRCFSIFFGRHQKRAASGS